MENIDLQNLLAVYIIPWGLKIITAFIIFYVGRMIVGAVVKGVKKVLTSRGMDQILVDFLSSIMQWVLLLFVVVAAMSQLGIDTTSLVALLGFGLVTMVNDTSGIQQ